MQRKYKSPPKEGSKRYRVAEIRKYPERRYALFRRAISGKSAYFTCVFGDKDEALEIARQYASESVASGDFDFAYYVVELIHRIGIEDGVMFDEPIKG